MHFLWEMTRESFPLITHGDPYLLQIIGFTLQVAALSTAVATVVGLPIALVIALGRFPGRRALQLLANAGLALPPVLVGLFLFMAFSPRGPFGAWHLNLTRTSVFIAQSILATPYVIALSSAAVQGLAPGLLEQARALGAAPWQVSLLALREARIGVVAAILAALGTSLSEVGAIAIVGGNIYGYNQTLASAALYEANGAHYADAIAIAIVLVVMIVILMSAVSVLQHQSGGIRMRFRSAT